MKELSIEQKAQRYDEAIERAKKHYEECKMRGNDWFVEDIEDMFPELKESEDELHRKWILEYLYNGLRKSDEQFKDHFKAAIAWLEAQGEHANFRNKIQIGDKVTRNEDGVLVNLSQLNRVAKKDEKQCEQKPADETKFKVGDWIITNKNHIWYVDETPETTSYLYRLINQYGKVEVAEFEVVDKNARLWTIIDAKAGDVLCTYECGKPKIVFILKGTPKIHYALDYHCYYNIMYHHFESDSEKGCLAPNDEDVKPATKEQCEQLEKAMADAGYTFDFEEKELKKIEQKPADNIEPKFKVGDIVQYITDSTDRRKIEEVDNLCNMYHTDSSPIMFEVEDEWKLSVLAEDVENELQVNFPQFTFDDVLALQCAMENVKKVQEDKDLYNKLLLLHNKVHDAYTITKNKLL